MRKWSLLALLPFVFACRENAASKTAPALHAGLESDTIVADTPVTRFEERVHQDLERNLTIKSSLSWVEGPRIEGHVDQKAVVSGYLKNSYGPNAKPLWTVIDEADGVEYTKEYLKLTQSGCCASPAIDKYYDLATGAFLGRTANWESTRPTPVAKHVYLLNIDQSVSSITSLPNDVATRLYLFSVDTTSPLRQSRLLDSLDVGIDFFGGQPCAGATVEKLTSIAPDSLTTPRFRAEVSCEDLGVIDAAFLLSFPPALDKIQVQKDPNFTPPKTRE